MGNEGKNDAGSKFDFDQDPEFNANFYRNIEKVLNDSYVEEPDDTKETGRPDTAETAGEAADAGVFQEGKEPEDSGAAREDKESEEDGTSLADRESEDEGSDESAVSGGAVPASDGEAVSEDAAGNELREEQEPSEETAAAVAAEDTDTQGLSEEELEEALTGINAALARKICEEMDCIGAEQSKEEEKKKHSVRIRNRILLTLLCLVGFGFFFGFTSPGNMLLMRMGINISSAVWGTFTDDFEEDVPVVEDIDVPDPIEDTTDLVKVDPDTIEWTSNTHGDGRHEEGVYNILVLGEEAIGSGSARGRTDVIIIATMNTNTKKLMLTSLMRDTLVQIPGYKDNKLNSAYEKGGLDLLYKTIALNFDIQLEGCVMVNFESFEKIIDKLGGLEITLTRGEANYLNTTNYISKPQYRNVVAGTQILNGNQVLGYTRVRKKATITGNNNDYGRTDRHRIVLNAIFEKYKTKSKMELATTMLGMLPMITTDISSKDFELLLNEFIEMGTMEITQLRIPADGTFTDNVEVRGMDVLIPDLQENVKLLHNFIFGKN